MWDDGVERQDHADQSGLELEGDREPRQQARGSDGPQVRRPFAFAHQDEEGRERERGGDHV
jgi:hypothetical protein